MAYDPLQHLMYYYSKAADFLRAHLQSGELEVKVEELPSPKQLTRDELINYISKIKAVGNAHWDHHYGRTAAYERVWFHNILPYIHSKPPPK